MELKSRRELFTDHALLERLEGGATLRLSEARPAGKVLDFDLPWEGKYVGYATVIKDGGVYRLYYRGMTPNKEQKFTTCYAESRDGIHWIKPKLGLVKIAGSAENNVILAEKHHSHNFSPFLDSRPGVPESERFKALSGLENTGLVAWTSADGIHWQKLREEPVLHGTGLDSQNVAFWSPAEECYVTVLRAWTGGKVNAGYRTIARATSPDFLQWSEPVEVRYDPAIEEDLYTNQTQPYFRAPHLLIALPMRFVAGRRLISEEKARELGIPKDQSTDTSELVFMSSRGGDAYQRTFLEGFVRPGQDIRNWNSRSGMTALGVVPTGPGEISFYKQANYAQASNHLLRYTLRTDGFTSIHAGFSGGEALTRPFTFEGDALYLNFATGAAGSIRVEIQDEDGKPLPGFALDQCPEIIGDQIDEAVVWENGAQPSSLSGKTVRLRFVLKDADLYALQFRASHSDPQ